MGPQPSSFGAGGPSDAEGVIATLRLAWRMQRWELGILIGGSLLLTALAALVAWQTIVTDEGLDACYADMGGGPLSASCKSLIEWGNTLTVLSPTLQGVTVLIPFAVGVLLGAPLVARELEKRTAPIAWSLSRSRIRWLGLRALPILFAIAIVLLALGQATEALIRATPPGDIGFPHFGMHGPLVAMRGITVFVIGVLVGLVVGRVLPAVLVTGVLVIALVIGLTLVRGELMRAEADWIDAASSNFSGVMVYDQAYTDDATGERITFEEAYQRFPEVFGPQGTGMPPGMSQIYLVTPPERYPTFVAREIGALALLGALAAGAGVWIVRSRRPDLG